MQSREPHEVFVVDIVVELMLGFLYENADLLESFQIPNGRRKEEAEHKVYGVGESQIALLLIRHEINHHVGFVVADRYANPFIEDDAKRHRGVRRARPDFLDIRDTQDNERPALIVVIT